jgi:hypothetical protein
LSSSQWTSRADGCQAGERSPDSAGSGIGVAQAVGTGRGGDTMMSAGTCRKVGPLTDFKRCMV